MALEEVSFYNILGEEVNLTNLVNQMINYYEQKLEVGETRITDFNEGSEIRNLLEAFAVGLYALMEDENDLAKLPFIRISYDMWLDRIGENPFINLPRITGKEATGTVTFTLAEAQASDFIIPAETVLVDSETDIEFITNSDCTIYRGELTGDVSVTCISTGVEGNSEKGNVNTISYLNTGFNFDLLSVTNNESFIGGTDYEDDDDYRERLLNNIRADGFGTIGYYTNLGNNIEGVHDVLLVDDSNYTKKIIVNGDIKPTPDNVLIEVLKDFTDINNIVLNHRFIVDVPEYTVVNLNVNLGVKNEIDESLLLNNLKTFFDGGTSDIHMEYFGLNINETIDKNRLYEIFNVFDQVSNVNIKLSGENEEISILTPTENGVLKLGDVVFTQSEV